MGRKFLEPCALTARIGRGGMGVVYRGRHLNLDVDVAVKCLDPALIARDETFLARFHREARLAARLNHLNVVRVYDVRESHGIHYLVMEFVDGETAAQRVGRLGALPLAEAMAIVGGAAEGLAVAHERGLVHRDIKPDNILIARDGTVKVADLGLTKEVAQGTEMTLGAVAMGTPSYMPPEQWEDAAKIGPAADVFALGLTLYFLLTGETAFVRGRGLADLADRIRRGAFPDIRERSPRVPAGVAALIRRCGAPIAGDRPSNAGELSKLLKSVASDATVIVPGALETAPPPARRSLDRPRRPAERNHRAKVGRSVEGLEPELERGPAAVSAAEGTRARSSHRRRRILQSAAVIVVVTAALLYFEPLSLLASGESGKRGGTQDGEGGRSADPGPAVLRVSAIAAQRPDLDPEWINRSTHDRWADVLAWEGLARASDETATLAESEDWLELRAWFDALVPALELDVPNGREVETSNASLVIKGRAVDCREGIVEVRLDGELTSLTVAPDTTFSTTLDLAEGLHAVELAFPDRSPSTLIEVVRDSTPPVLEFEVDGVRTSERSIVTKNDRPVLRVHVGDRKAHSASIDGREFDASKGLVEHSLTLDSKAQSVEVFARDSVGNQCSTIALQFQLDSVDPTDLRFSLDGAKEVGGLLVLPADGCAVAATLVEAHPRSVRLGGVELSRDDQTGQWRGVLSDLPAGARSLAYEAVDRAGNRCDGSLDVLAAPAPPKLLAPTGSPNAASLVFAGSITTLELVFDQPLVSVTVGSEKLALSGSATVSHQTNAPNSGGRWTIPWTALDLFGRTASGSLAIEVLESWGPLDALRDRFEAVGDERLALAGAQVPRYLRHVATRLVFCVVPGGTFELGAPLDDVLRAQDEEPVQKQVDLFLIAETEVTREMWVAGGGSESIGTSEGPAHPIVGVDWHSASDWCRRNRFELPSEAQWEYAASGAANHEYPGGTWDASIHSSVGLDEPLTGTRAVGSSRRSWCGAFDMAGNVSEWTSDIYRARYADPSATGTEFVVVRGGAFHSTNKRFFRTAVRFPSETASNPRIGFRPVVIP